ncbi:unnamed protein product [Ostreobium quekettii]|uniref:Uncharacterized protein n=1 Tax=Ostreobium quekettii TaxID=121088 RepID=A0A8S1IS16_9CHLO|nr:unnamed protein product [Ostreobium quekettii]
MAFIVDTAGFERTGQQSVVFGAGQAEMHSKLPPSHLTVFRLSFAVPLSLPKQQLHSSGLLSLWAQRGHAWHTHNKALLDRSRDQKSGLGIHGAGTPVYDQSVVIHTGPTVFPRMLPAAVLSQHCDR